MTFDPGAFDAKTLDERWQRNMEASTRRLALKERAIVHMGGKCQKCGYDTCAAAFDFHHLDDRDKDFNISSKQSWATIKVELEKCVLLCANCHRETHAGWHPDLLTLGESYTSYDPESCDMESFCDLDWGEDENDTDPCNPDSFIGQL